VIRIESSERHKVRKHKDIKGKRFMGLFGTEESKKYMKVNEGVFGSQEQKT
jgi:hypothetical protein